jgi:hypothetical protein
MPSLKDENVLPEPREEVSISGRGTKRSKGSVSGGRNGWEGREDQCGWRAERDSVCHVTREQKGEGAR